MPSTLFFLPGALGRMDFWTPLAERIAYPAEKIFIGWPDLVTHLVLAALPGWFLDYHDDLTHAHAATVAPLIDQHLHSS